MSASNLETVSNATRRIGQALTEVPHWLILETYWNTAMQQNNIWFIAFEACSKVILNGECRSNGPRWILHAQTGTRFTHKSIKLNTI
jgi:hypothetical protein